MKGDTIVALQSSVFSYRHWKWYGTIWQVSFESNLRNEVVVIAILQALLIHWNQFSVPNSILINNVLGVPFLQTKAKLTYLSSVFPSDDPIIQGLQYHPCSRLPWNSKWSALYVQSSQGIHSIGRHRPMNVQSRETQLKSRLTYANLKLKIAYGTE